MSTPGGKNRKFGRHGRNPSSINQKKRTEQNKAKRYEWMHAHKIKLSPAEGKPHPRPAVVQPMQHVIFSGVVRNQTAEALHCLFVGGVLLEIGSMNEVSVAKQKVQSNLEYRHEILYRNGMRKLVEHRPWN